MTLRQPLTMRAPYESLGYLWWLVHPERNIYAAIGDSGNIIYVDPKEQLVAAVASGFRPTVHDRIAFLETILLPTLNRLPRWGSPTL